MNAEVLIGTVVGTCVLQQLIGEGSIAAVFLAQQSQPPRQVIIKVLLPPNQQAVSPTPTPIPPGMVLYTYRGHSDRVGSVAWSPDGRRIASGSFDKTVQVWGAG